MSKGYEWIACVAAAVAIAVAAVSMCSRECSGSAVDGGVEGTGGVAGALSGDDGRRGLAERLERIVAEYPGEIGVAVIFDSADTVAVNDVAKYPMVSVFKLHQAVALCADFDRRGVSPDTVLTIRRYELDPDTWSPMLREHTEKEFALPVRELMRYTLTQSDNNASNLMFRRLLGVGATDRFVRAPFMVEGVLIGLFAAIFSTGLLYAVYTVAIVKVSQTMPDFTLVPFRDMALTLFGVFALIGVVIGLLGSRFTIAKYLRKEGSEFRAL